MAPQSFGQISMRAWEYYSSTMLADEAFEFLLFCDDGEWKLREWSTRSYPSWYRNKFIKDIDDELEKGESFLLLTIGYYSQQEYIQTRSVTLPQPANGAGTEEQPTEISEKDDNVTGMGNGTSASNSDITDEPNSTNDLDNTTRRSKWFPTPLAPRYVKFLYVHTTYERPTHIQTMDAGVPLTLLLNDPL